MKPLRDRSNKAHIETTAVDPDATPRPISPEAERTISQCAARIRAAKDSGSSVVLAFGAHTIKNGLGPVLSSLVEGGWVTHLATNGAGAIHDWEFSYLGMTGEDVAAGTAKGEFGNWEETGRYINMAINVGVYEGMGYGEAVGSLIHNEKLVVPDQLELLGKMTDGEEPEVVAAAAMIHGLMVKGLIQSGVISLDHPWKATSVFADAYRLKVPLTCHPMFGHDIIYNHPMNCGALLGMAAERDFEAFAHAISHLEGGVFMSVGSAVMAPMIFEKSLSITRNVALQGAGQIKAFHIQVVDLAASTWDWSQGEPPQDNAAYYLRYNKTFNRMGADSFSYLQADNRDFLCHLLHTLKKNA